MFHKKLRPFIVKVSVYVSPIQIHDVHVNTYYVLRNTYLHYSTPIFTTYFKL